MLTKKEIEFFSKLLTLLKEYDAEIYPRQPEELGFDIGARSFGCRQNQIRGRSHVFYLEGSDCEITIVPQENISGKE